MPSTSAVFTSQPQTSTPIRDTTAKTMKLLDPPEWCTPIQEMVRSAILQYAKEAKLQAHQKHSH